jgi:glutamate/tyrosine decarboxylase-like PLP-dependent enzyme
MWEPQGLGIVCFRAVPSPLAEDAAALDRLNRTVLSRLQLGGEAFLSGTVLDGCFWLRACVVNPNASTDDIDRMIDTVDAEVRQALDTIES